MYIPLGAVAIAGSMGLLQEASAPARDADYHALLSPSAAHTWMLCEQSVALGMSEPNESSEFADEGTAAHTLGSDCLLNGLDSDQYIGRTIPVGSVVLGCDEKTGEVVTGPRRSFVVDEEMAGFVQTYVDLVRSKVAMYKTLGFEVTLEIEQRVPIGHLTGEEAAEGTSDAIIIAVKPDHSVIEVIDLKYGRGVQVSAVENPQEKLYALGSIEKFALLADFDEVVLTISQPRVSEMPSEWSLDIADLESWALTVKQDAARALSHVGKTEFDLALFNPGEEQCRFCRGRAVCPALKKLTEETCMIAFDAIGEYEGAGPERVAALTNDELAEIYPALFVIDMFAKAVLAKIERLTLAGDTVPGTKVVKGRKGNRKWVDPKSAEEVLRSMRLKHDEMFDYKLASPTTIEKVLKEFPRKWKKAAAMVVQEEGKNTVVPESDPRPAVVIEPIVDQFEVADDLE